MTLPVGRPAGSLMERSFPGFGRGDAVAAEFDELFERRNRLLQGVATSPAAPAWSPAADVRVRRHIGRPREVWTRRC
ncbi:hypothetical protein ACFY1U_43040 [Streptomyces sp. NPDC001351]|uniref:hypothetical protein n=1 Tax=Streptomyces sp. NPDC001351 TaxID=3364564 RepID=UPI0036C9D532